MCFVLGEIPGSHEMKKERRTTEEVEIRFMSFPASFPAYQCFFSLGPDSLAQQVGWDVKPGLLSSVWSN